MNRRGFTLIELIVTLALLAIVSVISFVAIGGILEKNKDTECKNLVSSIKTAAKEYVSDNRYGLEKDENNQIYITGGFLVEKNYLSGDIVNPFDKNAEKLNDAVNITIKVYDDLTVRDVLVSNGVLNECQ